MAVRLNAMVMIVLIMSMVITVTVVKIWTDFWKTL